MSRPYHQTINNIASKQYTIVAVLCYDDFIIISIDSSFRMDAGKCKEIIIINKYFRQALDGSVKTKSSAFQDCRNLLLWKVYVPKTYLLEYIFLKDLCYF